MCRQKAEYEADMLAYIHDKCVNPFCDMDWKIWKKLGVENRGKFTWDIPH